MMPWWVLAVFVLGANFALWGSVGLVRLAESVAGRRRSSRMGATGLAGTGLPSAGLQTGRQHGPGGQRNWRVRARPARGTGKR